MDLKALIVDDEPLARQELQYLLEAAGGVQVLATGCNGIEAVDLIRLHRPQVVFLDVQMPGLDGFGVLKHLIGHKIELPQVVFATAYDRYAVRAFEVNAVDYLLKPFDRTRVEQTIEKARARIAAVQPPHSESQTDSHTDSQTAAKLDALLRLVAEAQAAGGVQAASRSKLRHQPAKVVLRVQSRLLLVDQSEICFATIHDGVISVTTDQVEGQSNCRTLEDLMEQLDPEIFWRAHRSCLVNIQRIREVVPWTNSSYQLRMDDLRKTEVPVSRNQTRRLRELFNL